MTTSEKYRPAAFFESTGNAGTWGGARRRGRKYASHWRDKRRLAEEARLKEETKVYEERDLVDEDVDNDPLDEW